jgi:hypothetical protein
LANLRSELIKLAPLPVPKNTCFKVEDFTDGSNEIKGVYLRELLFEFFIVNELNPIKVTSSTSLCKFFINLGNLIFFFFLLPEELTLVSSSINLG